MTPNDNPDEATLRELRAMRLAAARALHRGDAAHAHDILAQAKSLRQPLENIDLLRARAFLAKNLPEAAREALREELRYFPGNTAAQNLLAGLGAGQNASPYLSGQDTPTRELFARIMPWTMCGLSRVAALHAQALRVCQEGPDGNFVECGVAAGGTSGLLSAVLAAHAPGRRLFACDSFSGMPRARAEDVSRDGTSAQATGWGEGTCAAPESSLLALCESLGTRHVVTPVKGFFEETLPLWRERFGSIALLHMDGDWYSSTRAILENLYGQLAPGAYVQIDDYGYWQGCRKAVDEFFAQRGQKPDLTAIDGTGVWLRKA